MSEPTPRRYPGPLVELPASDSFVRLLPDAELIPSAEDPSTMVWNHNAIAIKVSRELLIDYGWIEPTPEEAAERARQAAAIAQRRAEREAAPAVEVTVDGLLELLEWSPTYAAHRLHPGCDCIGIDDDPYLCSFAREQGFTRVGGERS